MRRKKRRQEEENHERWLVSYADYITLLFAFFVVLYATSEQNTEKGKKFEESVKKYLVKVGLGATDKKTIDGEETKDSPIQTPINKNNKSNPQALKLKNRVEYYLEENFSERQINEIIQDIANEDVGLRITIKSNSLFDKNSAHLNKWSQTYLNKLGKLFERIQYRIFIESHTEDVDNSWELSAKRGTSLINYFMNEHDLDPSKVAAIS